MCVICPIVAATVIGGGLIVKGVKRIWPTQPPPKPLPLAVYGEDMDD